MTSRFHEEYERRRAAQRLGTGYEIDVFFWITVGGLTTVIGLFFPAEVVRFFSSAGSQETNGDRAADVLSPDSNFERSLEFILEVEGECSNHPADRGGFTCKGITESRAAQHGYTPDEITVDIATQIYREDYWEGVCDDLPFPVSLSCLNTSVNSGPGKAREFREQIDLSQSPGSQAIAFANLQEQHYLNIIRNDPSQAVFRDGWLNRSQALKKWIREPREQ